MTKNKIKIAPSEFVRIFDLIEIDPEFENADRNPTRFFSIAKYDRGVIDEDLYRMVIRQFECLEGKGKLQLKTWEKIN